MKRILQIAIAVLMAVSLAGCTSQSLPDAVSSAPSVLSSTAMVSSAAASSAPASDVSSVEASAVKLPTTYTMKNELEVTRVAGSVLPAQSAAETIAYYAFADAGGTTSIRFESKKVTDDNKYPENSKTVYGNRKKYPATYTQRDRDLGQTFRSGKAAQKLDAVYLRLGPNGADKSVFGSEVAIQIFEVTGTPKYNDHGTPGFLGSFDRTNAPELDDYLTGESYRSVAVAKGTLPDQLAPMDIMKWDLTGSSEVLLQPNKHYAFMILLVEKKEEQQLSLANNYYGNYKPDPSNQYIGHGIRREGTPKFSGSADRLKISPTTLGFPDVCTHRDYYFIVTGKAA